MTIRKELVFAGFLNPSALVAMLVGFPLLGVWWMGKPVLPYLRISPQTAWVEPIPFSWPIFFGLASGILVVVLPFIRQWWRTPPEPRSKTPGPLPWWGWIGLISGALAWLLAWTRFGWFTGFQRHTFTPLWLSYILVINALTYRRAGQSMITHRTKLFLALFPVSAVFWWFFEYLNRFTCNWHYLGGLDSFSTKEYIAFASISFSTVLPAVLSTMHWLASYPRIDRAFAGWVPVTPFRQRWISALLLILAVAGLAGLAEWTTILYPLIWVSPMVILLGIQTLAGTQGLTHELATGDWRRVVWAALAALICGCFWELWNCGSLAHWVYSIPYVQGVNVFEMPILGYAGYLPFGVTCLVVGDWVQDILIRNVNRASDPIHAGKMQPHGTAGLPT